MAVKLSAEDVGKLGPGAQAQMHAVAPDERPKPKRRRRNAEEIRIARAKATREEGKTSSFFADRSRRAQDREQRRQSSVKRKLGAQREREARERSGRRAARVQTLRTTGARIGRGTSRSAAAVPGNVSIEGLFGVLTGAALVGALVFRAGTVTALLGHMTSYWQRVIGLGKAAK